MSVNPTSNDTTLPSAEAALRPPERDLVDAWRTIAQAHQEQAARIRDAPPGTDAWVPPPNTAGPLWGDDKERREPEIEQLLEPRGTVLDIGGGAGLPALALAAAVKRITTIDPSPGMTALMEQNVADSGLDNVRVLHAGAWLPHEPLDRVDVCLTVNVTYFVEEIGLFLDAMESHAQRLCIVVSTELGTAFQPTEPLFSEIHGEPFIRQPARRELLAVLAARRRHVSIRPGPGLWVPQPREVDAPLGFCHGWYHVTKDTAKDRHLRELLIEQFGTSDGHVVLPLMVDRDSSVISWAPPPA